MEFIFFDAADQLSASRFYHSASRQLFTFVLPLDHWKWINVGGGDFFNKKQNFSVYFVKIY